MASTGSERAASDPQVSVIIPTHNRAQLALRAVRSVQRQTYEKWECIVVDDASTDSTPATMLALEDKRLVYLRHKENQGASAARNTGIAHARGELIAFLDDDDEWLPTKLEKQVDLLKTRPNVGMVYCWMDYHDSEGQLIHQHQPKLRGSVTEELLMGNHLGNASTILARADLVIAHEFDENLPSSNDTDFILRASRECSVDYVPEPLVRVHVGHKGRLSKPGAEIYSQEIAAELVKLDRFSKEMKKYPEAKIRSLMLLGHLSCKAGRMRDGRSYFRAASRVQRGWSKVHLLLALSSLGRIPYNIAHEIWYHIVVSKGERAIGSF